MSGAIICKVWDAAYPWDVRVEKVCRALTSNGHKVHLIARNQERAPITETRAEATVHRLKPWTFLPRALDGILTFPAFMNPRWYARIEEVVDRYAADLILCRDLPLAPLSVWIAQKKGIPCVVDLAENYPAMLGSREPSDKDFKPWDHLVRSPTLARLAEAWVLQRADHLLVVVEESFQHYRSLGVPSSMMSIVSNTPEVERLCAFTSSSGNWGRSEASSFRIVYLGGLQKNRGLDTAIRAMAYLAERPGPAFRLDIVGSGHQEAELRELSQNLGLAARVKFHGWLPLEEALEVVAACSVGLVPHLATEHTKTTVPNKLFDYMALGLPVLVSDVPPLRRIVTSSDAGFVFRSGDPVELANRALQLAEPDIWERMSRHARDAVDRHFRWSVDRKRLLTAVDALVGPGRSRRSADSSNSDYAPGQPQYLE